MRTNLKCMSGETSFCTSRTAGNHRDTLWKRSHTFVVNCSIMLLIVTLLICVFLPESWFLDVRMTVSSYSHRIHWLYIVNEAASCDEYGFAAITTVVLPTGYLRVNTSLTFRQLVWMCVSYTPVLKRKTSDSVVYSAEAETLQTETPHTNS